MILKSLLLGDNTTFGKLKAGDCFLYGISSTIYMVLAIPAWDWTKFPPEMHAVDEKGQFCAFDPDDAVRYITEVTLKKD